jgi:MarR family transcriptional regulator, lower aerobic nicotinate degradation pathway regulator
MRTVKTPSELQEHLGYWLRLVSNAVSHGFARKVEAKGVTVAEWVILRFLFDVKQVAPSQLAERMGMTKGAISKLADRLIEKGLVEREANLQDKRGKTLTLKRTGRQLVPTLAELADKNDAEFFSALTRDERRQLETLLRKIGAERRLVDISTS